MTEETIKRERADAVRNREALLVAAMDSFTEHGVGASLEDIARRAGVGVGTLYRNFKNRDELIAAVYSRELGIVADAAESLVLAHDGVTALREWTERFLEYAVAKRGLGDALRAIMDCSPDLRGSALPRLEAAVELIVAHGIADGTIRSDARADDLLRAMTAIFHIPHTDGWVDQARRILALLLDGLTPR